MIAKIRDDTIRKIVMKRLRENEINPDKKGGSIPKEIWTKPLYLPTKQNGRIPIKKVRITEELGNAEVLCDRENKPYTAVDPGSNHHVEIIEVIDSKGNKKREGVMVTMFQAVRRKMSGEPVVRKDTSPEKKFIMSLSSNEMFMLKMEDGTELLHRVQKMSQSRNNISIILRPHTYAGVVKDTDSPPIIQRKSPNTLEGYKVTVDPLGRIYPAND